MPQRNVRAAMVLTTLLGVVGMSACSQVETPPIGKLEVQYRQLVAGRHMAQHSEVHNLKLTNIRCRKQDIFVVCNVDATGDLFVRDSLKGTVDATKLDEKDVELKLVNRESLYK